MAIWLFDNVVHACITLPNFLSYSLFLFSFWGRSWTGWEYAATRARDADHSELISWICPVLPHRSSANVSIHSGVTMNYKKLNANVISEFSSFVGLFLFLFFFSSLTFRKALRALAALWRRRTKWESYWAERCSCSPPPFRRSDWVNWTKNTIWNWLARQRFEEWLDFVNSSLVRVLLWPGFYWILRSSSLRRRLVWLCLRVITTRRLPASAPTHRSQSTSSLPLRLVRARQATQATMPHTTRPVACHGTFLSDWIGDEGLTWKWRLIFFLDLRLFGMLFARVVRESNSLRSDSYSLV